MTTTDEAKEASFSESSTRKALLRRCPEFDYLGRRPGELSLRNRFDEQVQRLPSLHAGFVIARQLQPSVFEKLSRLREIRRHSLPPDRAPRRLHNADKPRRNGHHR
jgi:hypothetical protein